MTEWENALSSTWVGAVGSCARAPYIVAELEHLLCHASQSGAAQSPTTTTHCTRPCCFGQQSHAQISVVSVRRGSCKASRPSQINPRRADIYVQIWKQQKQTRKTAYFHISCLNVWRLQRHFAAHSPIPWHIALAKYLLLLEKQKWDFTHMLKRHIHNLAVWPAGAFKSRGSILKDANTSGGQAEAHRGGRLQQS